MPEREVVIINGARTAIGSFGGAIRDLTVVDTAAAAMRGALERSGVKAEQLDEVMVKPKSTDITLEAFGLAWMPYRKGADGRLSPDWQ